MSPPIDGLIAAGVICILIAALFDALIARAGGGS